MARKANTCGGGAQTNINGLKFEQETSLNDALEDIGYTVENCVVYDNGDRIGMSVPQHKLYSMFLKPLGINYKNYVSKKFLPDECFVDERIRTIYIIEKKFQNTSGSVDTKLAACGFFLNEYKKLFSALNYDVKYLYVLRGQWFNNEKNREMYKDIFEYIELTGCAYYFDEIPLQELNLKKSLSSVKIAA